VTVTGPRNICTSSTTATATPVASITDISQRRLAVGSIPITPEGIITGSTQKAMIR
jgi:hypothetical protein